MFNLKAKFEKPIQIEDGDNFKMVLSKYGALGLDKQDNLSEFVGERTGVLDIEKGIITFDGANIQKMNVADWTEVRKRSLSMLFQDLRLFTELTAMENVLLKNSLTGFKGKKEIKELFHELGIGDKMDVEVGKMSFGQQQRVALIRSLCQPFDFIFLDEPVSHLDEVNAKNMACILTEEAIKQGAGVLVTSIGKHLELDYTKKMML